MCSRQGRGLSSGRNLSPLGRLCKPANCTPPPNQDNILVCNLIQVQPPQGGRGHPSLAMSFRLGGDGDTEDKDCPEKVVGHSLPDCPHTTGTHGCPDRLIGRRGQRNRGRGWKVT